MYPALACIQQTAPKSLTKDLAFSLVPILRVITPTGLFVATYQCDTSKLAVKDRTAQGQALVSYGRSNFLTVLAFDLSITIPVLAADAPPYKSNFILKLGSIDNDVFNETVIALPVAASRNIAAAVSKATQGGKPTTLTFLNLFFTADDPGQSLAIRYVEERTYATKPELSLELDPVNTFDITNFNVFF